MSTDGDMASWVGQGVGTLKKDDDGIWRGKATRDGKRVVSFTGQTVVGTDPTSGTPERRWSDCSEAPQ